MTLRILTEDEDVALDRAIFNHDLKTAKELIKGNIDLNHCYKYCGILLNKACYMCVTDEKLDLVKLLLEYGADPNKAYGKTERPLAIAIYNSRNNLIKLLLEHGADPNLNVDGINNKKILRHACSYGHSTSLKLLLDHGADANIINDRGETILMYACQWSHIYKIRAFLKAGADLNARSAQGYTAYDYAKKHKNDSVVRYFNRIIIITLFIADSIRKSSMNKVNLPNDILRSLYVFIGERY
jgi:hypothetical protein